MNTFVQIFPSGDLKEEQETKDIGAEQLGQDIEELRIFFWVKMSRAFSKEAVGSGIWSRRQ